MEVLKISSDNPKAIITRYGKVDSANCIQHTIRNESNKPANINLIFDCIDCSLIRMQVDPNDSLKRWGIPKIISYLSPYLKKVLEKLIGRSNSISNQGLMYPPKIVVNKPGKDSYVLFPTSYFSAYQQQTDILDLPHSIQSDEKTYFEFEAQPNTTLTLTVFNRKGGYPN